MITDSDASHLECVEHESFNPIGWLYTNVFSSLYERHLVTITKSGAYIISELGIEELKNYREHKKVIL